MHGGQRRHHGVEESFGDGVAVPSGNRMGVHVHSHIAGQHKAAAGQGGRFTPGSGKGLVRVQAAFDDLAVFLKSGLQHTFHDPVPVSVDPSFVPRIYGGYGIFKVLNGGNGSFQNNVFYTGRTGPSHRMEGIDLYFHVQAVVRQPDVGQLILGLDKTDELRRVGKGGNPALGQLHDKRLVSLRSGQAIPDNLGILAFAQREITIEKGVASGDDGIPADRIVGIRDGPTGSFRYDVTAIEGVIQAAPAGVGGIEGVAGVVGRNNQLRTGHNGNFGIHILGFHGEILPFREEVSYGYEKIFIFLAGEGGMGVIPVPLVDQALQDISFFEEGGVDRGQVGHNSSQGPPKRFRINSGAGCNFVLDQFVKDRMDL